VQTSTPPRITPRRGRAAGTPVFAVKGESLVEYWDYTHRIFEWADGGTPNMILDDGGDATLLVHLGLRAEKGDTAFLEKASNEEEEVLFAAIKKRLKTSRAGTPRSQEHQGCHRGDHHRRPPALHHGAGRQAPVPGHQRQRLVTKSKFDISTAAANRWSTASAAAPM